MFDVSADEMKSILHKDPEDAFYIIKNIGCDDETTGLVHIPKEIANDAVWMLVVQWIRNLNKNSEYGCMPTIEVYKIPESMIRLATDEDHRANRHDVLYTCEGEFVLTEEIGCWSRSKCEYVLKKGVTRII